ncbi:shadow of prion protein 2 [Sebastes umbrosus]|uniref:shadow of prion protein 2 n=1 Tax=Sebastes umbrosus TaxID=72105 RepID=UPI00189F1585|nr:shadow of prion protein 2 [Sebastes umbrosus]
MLDIGVEMMLIPSVLVLTKDCRSSITTSQCDPTERSPVMTGQQKLLSLWVWLLLMAALCPGVDSKRGGIFKGRGKDKDKDKGKGDGDGDKAPPSKSRGLPKQGLKWAGAAAAGMLGGTGTGYGLGLFGRPKHKSHHGHKTSSSEQDQRHYHDEGQRSHNQSLWRAIKAAAPAPTTNMFLTLGHVVSFLIAAWIRDI